MGLTQNDLMQIRSIVQEVVQPAIQPLWVEITTLREDFKVMQGSSQALHNDVKEIYFMLAELEIQSSSHKV